MNEDVVVERPEERAQEIDVACGVCGTPWGPCPVHKNAIRVIRDAMNDAREGVLFEIEQLLERGWTWRDAVENLKPKSW